MTDIHCVCDLFVTAFSLRKRRSGEYHDCRKQNRKQSDPVFLHDVQSFLYVAAQSRGSWDKGITIQNNY
ncbi:MAG: hypothetical protein K6G29_12700, partial [Clostridiales bacterium]|nr:hypothetical protein [Clostridiales bacterium]